MIAVSQSRTLPLLLRDSGEGINTQSGMSKGDEHLCSGPASVLSSCSPTRGDPWPVQPGLLDQCPPLAFSQLETWLCVLKSRKPAPQGALHLPRGCGTAPWPSSAFPPWGMGARRGEEEGFLKENRLEKDTSLYSPSVAL